MRHVTGLVCGCFLASAIAASPGPVAVTPPSIYDPSHFQQLKFRHIGPFRGGRSTAVSGVTSQPFTFYLGSTGGGVFKSTDAGNSWRNVSDGYFAAGSIGAIAVSESQPEVIYVGTGSACPRGNVSPGIGMYKSTDAGATWTHVGLRDAGQIAKLAVHPSNPDIVYVAALGHIFGPNAERGVFRTRDGGRSWSRVLFLNDETGAVDVKLDVNNPEVVYAAFWRAERKPWTIISGGKEGGIYKSVNGGDTWEKLKTGLPLGMTGRIGIAVSPANSQRVWAIIEGERVAAGFPRDETGMYRSDDGGQTWQYLSADPELHQRPWYYHHLTAHPRDQNIVYHVGDKLWKSVDGGTNFSVVEVPHVDEHDLWINPNNPEIMVEANDGGATVTLNGGLSWTSQTNQPTAELYQISVDDGFPYRVYAGQQDYSTISLPSQAFLAGGITLQHWTAVGGTEIGPVAVDPMDPDIVYAGGYLSRMTRSAGRIRRIMDYPQYWSGVPSPKLRYRVPSDAPVLVSSYDPHVVYSTSQFVHRSRNGGESWEIISPDLTRNDGATQIASGGPLTHDITSVETYGAIVSFEESRLDRALLWAGSDDGMVHVSRDSGKTWVDVTPAEMPKGGRVNTIDVSRHDAGRAILAVTRYMLDDFRPYIFMTEDYGKHWKLISTGHGIPDDHFVRVAREDEAGRGLLYTGTEFGLYISFDNGNRWMPFQLNLPVTPVSDLELHRDDLIVGTQGRGFWILDDISPLRQIREMRTGNEPFLFKPRDTYRIEGGWREPGPYISQDELLGALIETDRIGENPAPGASISYYLPATEAARADIRVKIRDGRGELVRVLPDDAGKLPGEPGFNRISWDLTYSGADVIPNSRLDGYVGGPRVLPGAYTIELHVGPWSQSQELEVIEDPRSEATKQELEEQFKFLMAVRDKITQTHDIIRKIRSIREELEILESGRGGGGVAKRSAAIRKKLDDLEDHMRQKRAVVWQDTANFEPLLDDQFAWLASYVMSADARPTASAYQRDRDLTAMLESALAELDRIQRVDIPAFRKAVGKLK